MKSNSSVCLSVRLRAFEWIWVKRTIRQLTLVSECFDFSFSTVVSLPKQKTQYTVIRSPHIDKHSREQYEQHSYHALIDFIPISLKDQHKIYTLIRTFQSISYAGTELEIRLFYSTGFEKKKHI